MPAFVSRRTFLRAIIAAGGTLAAAPVLGLSNAGDSGIKLALGRGATAVPLESERLAQCFGGGGLPISVPREQVYVVDQIFRYSVANNFNMFVPGGPPMPTRQGLVMDMLWYIDQDSGEWINSLAADRPTYSADNLTMTLPLRL